MLARRSALLIAFVPLVLAVISVLATGLAAAGPCPPSGSGGC